MEQKKCPNCGEDLKQKEGKREKKFCNSTCRSSYWQKNNKKEKKYKLVPIEEYKKLTEKQLIEIAENATKGANPDTKKKFDEQIIKVEEHFTIEPKNDEQPPERKEGENSIDYRIRRAEWFEQKNKK